ncbi:MAG: hypothetical protein QG560_1329, partial [Campylobacterota bacterium]|nr:hypothetical protein [Campylobacterota bacterium]
KPSALMMEPLTALDVFCVYREGRSRGFRVVISITVRNSKNPATRSA